MQTVFKLWAGRNSTVFLIVKCCYINLHPELSKLTLESSRLPKKKVSPYGEMTEGFSSLATSLKKKSGHMNKRTEYCNLKCIQDISSICIIFTLLNKILFLPKVEHIVGLHQWFSTKGRQHPGVLLDSLKGDTRCEEIRQYVYAQAFLCLDNPLLPL